VATGTGHRMLCTVIISTALTAALYLLARNRFLRWAEC